MRLSAYLLGVFSPSLPQQRHRLQALCAPWSPDTPPLGGTSGERDPGSRLGHGFRGRAWQSLMQARSSILVKQVGEQLCESTTWTLNKYGMKSVIDDIYRRGPPPPLRDSHTDLSQWHDESWLHVCYQVDVLFYSGEEVWAASGKPAPNSKRRGRLWIGLGMKRRERGAIQSTIPFLHCLPA